jgi:hypothetical protein
MKKRLSLALVWSLLLTLTSAPQTFAQAPNGVRQRAEEAGIGSYLEVRLKDGSRFEGRVEALEPGHVALFVQDGKDGMSVRRVRYEQVAALKGVKRTLYRAQGEPDPFLARQAVEGLGVGEHVMVRTWGEVIRRGNIKAIDAQSFTIRLDSNGEPATINYAEVLEVHENPHLQIIAAVVVAIGVAVAALVIVMTRKSGPQPFVSTITPKTLQAGRSAEVRITGNNFAAGDIVSFKGGDGPTPTATNVTVVDANTITATVTVNSGGPNREREWDVVVTNSKRKTGRLKNGLVVAP